MSKAAMIKGTPPNPWQASIITPGGRQLKKPATPARTRKYETLGTKDLFEKFNNIIIVGWFSAEK